MNFSLIPIGKVLGKTIHHGVVHLDFSDYKDFFKTQGKNMTNCEVYTSSDERGRDYMLGFDFTFDDGTTEHKSFKAFWHEFDHEWNWGSKSVTLEKYSSNPYKVLDLTYTEVVFQTHSHGGCAFDRLHDRVTGITKDIYSMKEYVDNFNKSLHR